MRIWILSRRAMGNLHEALPQGWVINSCPESPGKVRRRLRRAHMVLSTAFTFVEVVSTLQWLGKSGEAASVVRIFVNQPEPVVFGSDGMLVLPIGPVTGRPVIEYCWAEKA